MLPCLLVGGGGVLFYLKRMRELEKSGTTRSARRPRRAVTGARRPASTSSRCVTRCRCTAARAASSCAAGPTPREVPKGGQPVPFPEDEAFQKLGFAPGTAVRFQYQVVVKEDPVGEPEVTCYARGDQDGDGQIPSTV